MRIADLSYSLGPENIACEPPEIRHGRRDLGRMLVVTRSSRSITHASVFDLPEWLRPGDVFVLNNSKRMPGIIFAKVKGNSAQVELRFAGVDGRGRGICRIYPDHHVQRGSNLSLPDGTVLRVVSRKLRPHGLYRVGTANGDLRTALKNCGYPITSFFSKGYWKLENYNNYYATEEGSIESPMAGMHLTPELVSRMHARGVETLMLTLHSVGSWLPVLEDKVGDHKMLSEWYNVPEETADRVNRALADGNRRVIACGSTVVRTLESAFTSSGRVKPGAGRTRLYISPGYRFRVVNAYFTNFHTSRSSLIVLDAAFAGKSRVLSAYKVARKAGYLFHEFGDAIFYV